VKGEGKHFYSAEEVIIAYNEGRVDLHAYIKVKTRVRNSDDTLENKLLETTVAGCCSTRTCLSKSAL